MQAQQHLPLEQDNLSAQRAAVEALEIGRATLVQAKQQGEQLDRAESISDDTQYALDKAGRILRGMTWSGWVANMFTSDVKKAESSDLSRRRDPPMVYEGLPESCKEAAQAIQNYHVNVQVLIACETSDQRETCCLICDNMYNQASRRLEVLKSNPSVRAYHEELFADLQTLRERQKPVRVPVIQTSKHQLVESESQSKSTQSTSESSQSDLLIHPSTSQQEEHLQFLSQNLDELGYITQTLNEAIHKQNSTVDRLEEKSESILEESQLVTRRADRLVNRTSWMPPKPTFECLLVIRHLESGKYLSVVNGDLYLIPQLMENCVFALWKRQNLVGLRHKASDKWMGQNLLGTLVCTATCMGRREEWQIDGDNWSSSTLLCASACWGAGGYLVVRPRDHAVLLGGSGVEEKKRAARWMLQRKD